jgi:hypothetical protein
VVFVHHCFSLCPFCNDIILRRKKTILNAQKFMVSSSIWIQNPVSLSNSRQVTSI